MKIYNLKNDVVEGIIIGVNTMKNNKIVHRFGGYGSYEELFYHLQQTPDIKRCYFEVIKSNCKPYLDIDFMVDDNKNITSDIINNIIADILYVFSNTYNLPLNKEDILIGESHKSINDKIIKYSWHIIIDPVNYTYIYSNNRFDNEDSACDLVYQLYKLNPLYIEIIDRSVYTKDREMRMFCCNKSPDNLRLIKYNNYNIKTISFNEFSRTLINYINPDKEIKYISTVYRENPRRILHTKNELLKIDSNKKVWAEKTIKKDQPIIKIDNNNSNSNSNFINDIINNIGDYRADNYEDWINILFILKNQSLIDKTDYFNIFNEFSKKSIKYNYNEVLEYWNNNIPRINNGLTIGSLINYLIEDNGKAWEYINNKYNKIDSTTIINNFYYPDPHKYFNEIVEYEDKTTHDFKIREGNKGLFINIEMGMGKTETLLKQIKRHNVNILKKLNNENFLNYNREYKRILIITHRRTLAGKFYGDLEKQNYKLYFDYKKNNQINSDKLIIQLDSLYKITLKDYDLVVLDECESLLSHFSYDNMNHKQENIDILAHHIKQAQRVILMDANMSIKSFEIMKQIDDLTKYTYIHNKYQILKGWNMTFMNGSEQTENIKKDIDNNKNVVIASLSKTLVDSHYSKIIPNHLIFSSDTDNEEKFKGVMHVNDTWKDKNILYTPSISAGVSCTLKDQFNNIYGYSNDISANATDFIQMLRRCRYPINNNFMVWYEAKNNKKPYCLSIDEIENYIKYNCLVNNHNDIIKDIHKFIRDGKYDIMKDLYYYITIYNTLENNINSCFFKDVLINLSTNKGIHIMESTRLNEDNKKFDNMIKEQKKELRNKLYDELIKYDPITQQEYDEINKKMNHEQKLTDDEKNKHKLKTLLNRFKYPNEKYNNLDNNNKLSLIKFMDDDMNHEIFINKSNVLIRDTVEESIKYINEQDKQRLNTAPNDHNYKQYHRMHLLIDKLIKILGFNNIEDYETKINNDDLKKKLDDNKIDLLNIINEINYINKNKLKDKITNIKTINTIINNFYGHKLERLLNTTKDKKMTVSFKISNSIKWGESYLPSILKIDKINHNEYLF